MKTVLITGAHGFLGKNCCAWFKREGWQVIGIGHGQWGFEKPEEFGIDLWIEADVDFSSLETISQDFSCVVHCAGGSSVGYSLQNPLRDFRLTVESSVQLLEYLRLTKPKARLIYPSSAAVYGKKENSPLSEIDLLEPVSPYGFHKKIVEELCASYAKNYQTPVSVIRFFSIYGPGLKKQLLWDACGKMVHSPEEVVFWGTGDETRDWIHVSDASSLIGVLAGSETPFEIINGGSGVSVPIAKILSHLAARFDQGIKIGFNQQCREGDPQHYWADIGRASKKGWRPQVTLDAGICQYVEWYKGMRK